MEYRSNGRQAIRVRLGLDRIVELAREISGARYAALDVLKEQGTGLEQFLTACPLRLADVRRHPGSHGFPPGHPLMSSFLGVPVMVRGRAWGSLQVAEKAAGEFTLAHEEAIVGLAVQAAAPPAEPGGHGVAMPELMHDIEDQQRQGVPWPSSTLRRSRRRPPQRGRPPHTRGSRAFPQRAGWFRRTMHVRVADSFGCTCTDA
jgi:GAF domain